MNDWILDTLKKNIFHTTKEVALAIDVPASITLSILKDLESQGLVKSTKFKWGLSWQYIRKKDDQPQ